MNFFSVTTKKNLPVLTKSVALNFKFHDIVDYIIICPAEDVTVFKDKIKNEKVKVVDENQIISIEEFKRISSRVASALKKEEINVKRIPWYYQQVLKLTYSLSTFGNVVMWDADTVPMRKIDFFNDGEVSLKFGADIEYHEEYFSTLDVVSDYIRPKYAYTIQFYSHAENERQRILAIIDNFIPDASAYELPEKISMLLLNSIYNQNLEFKNERSSYFSEQEFVGCFKSADEIQLKIKHFRPGRFWNDSKLNTTFLRMCGYSYYTVEANAKFKNTLIQSLYFFAFLISDILKITKIRRLSPKKLSKAKNDFNSNKQ